MCESCSAAPANERGSGRGRPSEAAAVPRSAPPPATLRARRLRSRAATDARRRVQPVVPRHCSRSSSCRQSHAERARRLGGPDLRSALGDKLERVRAISLDVDARPARDRQGRRRRASTTTPSWPMLVTLALRPPHREEPRISSARGGTRSICSCRSGATSRRDPLGQQHEDAQRPGAVASVPLDPDLPAAITRVLAVDRLRKVNALVGFTRIDEMDRVNDLTQPAGAADPDRPADLDGRPPRTAARASSSSSTKTRSRHGRRDVEASDDLGGSRGGPPTQLRATATLRRPSQSTQTTGCQPPRYWLLHTFAHLLIREMAMKCGYSAAASANGSTRGRGTDTRPAAAGLLISTTASDSDGTLGGLVQLSEPERLEPVVADGAAPGETLLVRPGRAPRERRRIRRTSCTAPPATAAPWPPRLRASGPTGSSTAGSFVDLPGSNLGFFGDPYAW